MRRFSLRDDYRTKIIGLGEIYETLSCRYLMEQLRERYPGHYMITFLSRRELDHGLAGCVSDRSTIIASGFADIPPWRSGFRPLQQGSGGSALLRFISFVRPVLELLVSTEQWYPRAVKAKKAHIVWYLCPC